jgi:hypothetical protein
MSSRIWQKFPVTPGLHVLEMKDRCQKQVMEDTRGASPVALVAYFREASRRFWRVVDGTGAETVESPMVVRDADRTPCGD